jgi:hypothetical protein
MLSDPEQLLEFRRTGLSYRAIGRHLRVSPPRWSTGSLVIPPQRPAEMRSQTSLEHSEARHRPFLPLWPARPRADGATRTLATPGVAARGCPGVSDRAELHHLSRWRRGEYRLPLLLTVSALRSKGLSRLQTRPAGPPVSVSPSPSRTPTHDSGPGSVAGPSPDDSFIRKTSPV